MKPIDFVESNRDLTKPKDMTDAQCQTLPIHNDGEHCISLWKADWKERLRFLFTGEIWLWVRSGMTQPPVKVSTTAPKWCPADYASDIGTLHDAEEPTNMDMMAKASMELSGAEKSAL